MGEEAVTVTKQAARFRQQPVGRSKPDPVVPLTRAPRGYAAWIADVKARVRAAQMRASLAVNRELIALYWSIGRDLVERRVIARAASLI